MAVILTSAGTWYGPGELKAWGLLFGLLAAGLFITTAIRESVETVQAYIQKWSHQVFEDGFRAGVEQGREMEATQQFIASTTDDR